MTNALEVDKQCSREVRNFLEKFFIYLQVEKKYSAHTLVSYRTDLFYFFNFIFNSKEKIIDKNVLQNLTLHDFRKWLVSRLDNHINASNARGLSSLRSFFRFLHKNNLLKNDEIEKIKTPKTAKPVPKAVDAIDIKKIMQAIIANNKKPDQNWQVKRDIALLTLIYGCGLRISEALSVTPKSLDNNEFLIVNGKGNKQRMVPLLPIVRHNIDKYLQECPFKPLREESIFFGTHGKPYLARLLAD